MSLPQPLTTLPSHTLPRSAQAVQPTDEDYNIPSQERLVLLEHLQTLVGDVPPHFYAACQFCDLQNLKTLVQIAELSPEVVGTIAKEAYTLIKIWNQSLSSSATSTPQSTASSSSILRRQHQSSPGSGQDTTTPPAKRQKMYRSVVAKENAKRRDDYHCVLTHLSHFEVAHIYPFYYLNIEEDEKFGTRHNFWQMLKVFWSKEKVSSWQVVLFPNGLEEKGKDVTQNLITLSSDMHGWWNKGFFALKPISISEDKRTLTIQFFWQAKHSSGLTINLTTLPLSTKDLDRSPNNDSMLYRADRSHFIKSGDLFELTTDDPEVRPLPDIGLLEMQWHLQRIMGMAGAADEYSDLGFDEHEDDISNLGLDEAGDESFISSSSVDPISDKPGGLPFVDVLKHPTGEWEESE